MQLGALLSNLDDETDAGAALDTIGDLVLYAAVFEMGARYDEAPGQYISAAVRRFASRASDEDWLGLMAAAENGDDPGRSVLQQVLRWALARDAAEGTATLHSGCSCKGGPRGAHGHL